VFVLLPKREADQIKDTLASYAASDDTMRRPTPQTDEGKAAQRAMSTRRVSDDERLTALFQDVVARARVLQGGGAELTTSTLRDAVETAANRSLIRLFPKFGAGDNANWGKVVTKARDGAPDALDAVGHHGEPTTNAVCKEVLAAISPSGSKGTDLQRRFGAPPFGWPKDAVNGAVLTLFAAGNIRAVQDGKDLTGPRELQPNQIGKVSFYKEDEPPSVGQRIAVKGLLTTAGIPYEPSQEGAQIPALLQKLKDLAALCGGAPPLPEPPSTEHLEALAALAGNQRFRAVADEHNQLSTSLEQWQSTDKQRGQREASWRNAERLVRHADGITVVAQVSAALDAIREGRQLLDDPDPVAPIVSRLVDALRAQVQRLAAQLEVEKRAAVAELQAWEDWSKITPADQELIVSEANLAADSAPDVSTADKLLSVLDDSPLRAWYDRISLVPSRRDQARLRAAKALEPESVSVSPPSATIKSKADLEGYIDELRKRVQPHLDAHKTVII
jgi:hypothetical protein